MFASRSISFKLLGSTKHLKKCFSVSAPKFNDLVKISYNEGNKTATVSLNSPPVNVLNLELLTSLNGALVELKKNKVKGMILTSSNKVFSAGLDISEFLAATENRERFVAYWTMLQDVWINLYGAPYRTVAAINGHSPAGGCLLALSCEHRIMAQGFTIGLNETRLGIVAPPFFIISMKSVIGQRKTESSLLEGKLYTTDEALNIGLIDEVAANKDDALSKANEHLEKYDGISSLAMNTTKDLIRGNDIKSYIPTRQKELEMVSGLVQHPNVQKMLNLYKASLKK